MAATTIDIWSGIDHKAQILDRQPWHAKQDLRRLNFYQMVRAYLETVARHGLTPTDDEPDQAAEWVEMGDAAALVDSIVAAVLGEEIGVQVQGAGYDPGDTPDLPAPPEPPRQTGNDVEAAILQEAYDAALEVYEIRARDRIAEWLAGISEADAVEARQEYLADWAESSGFLAAVVENETEHVVPLGSGVYVFGFDGTAPDVDIYGPDTYFPALDDGKPSQFPDTIHLVWSWDNQWTRRITYELLPLEDVPNAPALLYQQPQPATHHCVVTDVTWPRDQFRDCYGPNPGGEPRIDDGGNVLVRHPIGLDFIPVLHVPHDLARSRHFGRSALARLFQLLDEIAAADSDESLASRWASQPPVGVSGMAPGDNELDLTPGRGVRLDTGGGIYPIDMSKGLEVLLERTARLLKRLAVASKVPEGFQGRVDASDVPSGFALIASFTALSQMVNRARLARDAKYRLGLKMVQRIAIQGQDPAIGDDMVYPAAVEFGSYLSADLPSLASMLRELMDANLVSQETAVQMLQAAGMPIESAREEVLRIRAIMFEEADTLTGAVENPKAAAKFLGRPEYVDTERDLIDPAGPVLFPDLATAQ